MSESTFPPGCLLDQELACSFLNTARCHELSYRAVFECWKQDFGTDAMLVVLATTDVLDDLHGNNAHGIVVLGGRSSADLDARIAARNTSLGALAAGFKAGQFDLLKACSDLIILDPYLRISGPPELVFGHPYYQENKYRLILNISALRGGGLNAEILPKFQRYLEGVAKSPTSSMKTYNESDAFLALERSLQLQRDQYLSIKPVLIWDARKCLRKPSESEPATAFWNDSEQATSRFPDILTPRLA